MISFWPATECNATIDKGEKIQSDLKNYRQPENSNSNALQ